MRLTIFWRVLLAQLSLIILILAVSLYALSQLNQLTSLSTNILSTDTVCLEEEKRLLKIFLTQMRSAEKYAALRDKAFHDSFSQGARDFNDTLEKVSWFVDTQEEKDLIQQIRDFHARYVASLPIGLSRKSQWSKDKTVVSEGITSGINDLIRIREEGIASKTAFARDQAASAAGVVAWFTLGGICIAVLLAYFQARGVSRPLKELAQELRYVGKGEFRRSVEMRSPREVGELARAFNWMAERLAELDEMKADFIAHVSHDLRTPLTAIQEGTALVLEEIPGPLTVSQREVLEVVRSHSERLFHTISSVLDLSKMEAGMMEYSREPTDIGFLIERSVETVRLIAQKKRIQLEAFRALDLPLVYVDEQRIRQVLDALLSNAIKFTPEQGSVRISATLANSNNGQGREVEIRVSDSGDGVPGEEKERIFERFYQSPHHRTERQRGSGLGLAIARHIVEAHGGHIWAENQEGRGAIFAFTLPSNENFSHTERRGDSLLGQQRGVGDAA
jgi:two-component system sensor histidine kinase GlrK